MAEIKAEVVPLENKAADIEKLKIDLKAQAQIILSTYVINRTSDFLQVIDVHFWEGHQLTFLPDVPSWHYAITRQIGTTNVKFGFVYANGTDSTAQKWVVAFDYATQKAYAEDGPIGPVDWNVIEVKLRMSEGIIDPIVGAKSTAIMDGLSAYAIFDN